jgi:hypothetical protein
VVSVISYVMSDGVIRRSSWSGNVSALACSVASSLFVVGFSPLQVANILTVFSVITFIGASAWRWLRSPITLGFDEALGAGLAVGLAALVLIGVSAHLLPPVVGPLLLAVAVVGCGLYRLRSGTWGVQTLDNSSVALLGLVPVLAVAPFNITVLPFVLLTALVGIVVVASRRTSAILTWTGLIASLTMAVAYERRWLTRPWIDIVSFDVVFDESLANGVLRDGLAASPTLLGQSNSGHIIGHAALGVLLDAVPLPAFAIFGAGSYVVLTTAVALLVYAAATSRNSPSWSGWLAVMILFAMASAGAPAFVVPALRGTNMLPLLWSALALWTFQCARRGALHAPQLVVVVATLCATATKVPWGALSAGAMVFLAAIDVRLQRRITASMVTALMSVAASIALAALILGGDTSQGTEIGLHLGLVASATALLVVRYFFLAVVLGRSKDPASVAIVMLVTLVLATWAATTGGELGFYLFPILSLVMAFQLSGKIAYDLQLGGSGQKHRLKIVTIASALTGLALALFHLYFVGALRYGVQPFGLVVPGQVVDVASVIACVALTLVGVKMGKPTIKGANVVAFVVAASMSVGMFAGQTTKPLVHRTFFGAAMIEARAVSDRQISVGEWLAAKTSRGDLIATNSLCSAPLSLGSEFPLSAEAGDCGGRNQNPWISALAARPMLIEAPRYGPFAQRTIDDQLVVDYYNVSVEYGHSGNEKSRIRLKNWGVQWFVVDTALAATRNWGARITYSNNDFVVLDLRS